MSLQESFHDHQRALNTVPSTINHKPSSSDRANLSTSHLNTDRNSNLGAKVIDETTVAKDKKVSGPTQKERWAYAIEFSAKIIYPLSFIIYNIVYWTSYYGL